MQYSSMIQENMPIISVPMLSINKETKASGYSHTARSKNPTIDDRNPRTSRRLYKMPISTSVNAPRSMEKLFSNACHTEKQMVPAATIRKNRISGPH